MLEHPVKLLLLPNRSDNVKVMDNQQGGIMIEFDKNQLNSLYEQHGSIKAVAKFLDLPYSTIHYHFKEYKIGNYKNRGIGITKEDLVELHDKYGSITKVASAISKNYATVRSWYSFYNIVINDSNMNVFQELRKTPMNQLHKSVVLGSMLGDGCLRKVSHSKNALLEISHCEKQIEYLKWKKHILDPFSRPIVLKEIANPQKEVCGHLVNASNFYRFHTIAHEDITKIYDKYYRDGSKGISIDIINDIDLVSTCIWFSDDGSIQRNNKGEPNHCSIATNSFSYKEQLILVEALRRFFGGKIKIKEHGGYYKGIKREDFVIDMSGKEEINKFLDMIKLVLPECIHYKLS